jgi:hypothetical protein
MYTVLFTDPDTGLLAPAFANVLGLSEAKDLAEKAGKSYPHLKPYCILDNSRLPSLVKSAEQVA